MKPMFNEFNMLLKMAIGLFCVEMSLLKIGIGRIA